MSEKITEEMKRDGASSLVEKDDSKGNDSLQIVGAINHLTNQLKEIQSNQIIEGIEKAKRERTTNRLLFLTFVITLLTYIVFFQQLQEMRKDKRPWIGVSETHFESLTEAPLATNKDYNISIFVTNTGERPAKNVKINYITTINIYNKPPSIADLKPCKACGDYSMTPHEPSTLESAFEAKNFTKETIQKIENGNATIYFFAQIDYEDVSGGSYKTKICYALNGKNSITGGLNVFSCPSANANQME